MEATEIRIEVAGAEIVEAEIRIEAFSGVEVGVGGVSGRGDEGSEGVVVEDVGDESGFVGEVANAS